VRLEILSVGKPKSNWLMEGIEHYRQLSGRYAQLDLRQVRQSSGSRGAETVKKEESARLAAKLDPGALKILLDQQGKQLDSIGLAKLIERTKLSSSRIQIVVGGAFGVTEEFRQQVDRCLSLSRLTLPHDLALLFIMEQLFRALSILAGSKYHK
jgi:23S rRNA (pseudouridine1915-N3)-methyltransferase